MVLKILSRKLQIGTEYLPFALQDALNDFIQKMLKWANSDLGIVSDFLHYKVSVHVHLMVLVLHSDTKT